MATNPKDIAENAIAFAHVDDIEVRILARAYLTATKPEDATQVELSFADKREIRELAGRLMREKAFDRGYTSQEILVDIWVEAVDTIRRRKVGSL